MPTHRDDELPSLEAADLANVTGGGGFDISTMLPIMLMMRNRSRAAAAAQPMPAPTWKPKVIVDGVEQQGSSTANGTTFTTSG
jgi:hypothetical protein